MSSLCLGVEDHVDAQLKQFHDYDDALTCVAAWYHLLKERPEYGPFTRHFEWFPRTELAGQSKTPDFTALLTRAGIVGEIKSSLPQDDSAFDTELTQINAYAGIASLPDGLEFQAIGQVDVILLVKDACADEVAQRLIDRYSDPSHWFSPPKCPVIMAYSFVQDYGETRFVMRRVPLEGNGVFGRMETHPEGSDLYHFLCERKKSIRLPPESWVRTKAKYMIMNDAPPAIFCAVFLWRYLTQYAISAKGYRPDLMRSTSYFSIDISAADISSRIKNDVFYNDTLDIRWIQSGIRFLREADLAAASARDPDKVVVKLQPGIGARPGALSEESEPVDVARALALRHAKAVVQKKPKSRRATTASTEDQLLPLEF